ncbi:Rap1a/Tai family immunity protein [Devosia sp. J2-20]|uniref:Rap1a/Tai family immunity protein n=1 Tax=Devosia sp. J2-20 TaxID=3026161 RepID=UPI00249B8051|nr:Rap1a/Tai family immunity protein [Devosia sp. J2-20]WDR00861.1 Rap1a/Tai family immunity protein [Devosia sp. J2-20]
MNTLRVVVSIGTMLIATAAYAESKGKTGSGFSISMLRASCSDSEPDRSGLCLGYFLAALDMQGIVGDDMRFCLPTGASLTSLSDEAFANLPEGMFQEDEPAIYAVVTGLRLAYPC